jgi:hypothetical protein
MRAVMNFVFYRAMFMHLKSANWFMFGRESPSSELALPPRLRAPNVLIPQISSYEFMAMDSLELQSLSSLAFTSTIACSGKSYMK